MCVAAVIFKPVPLDDLKAMEDNNPHGAGIAWEQDGQIRFIRGLTAADIYQLQEDKVMTYPYLMHYRWATHGAKVPELTHPFVVGPRALMGELRGAAEAVLIHNGTWNAYERYAVLYSNLGNYEIPEEILEEMSDTAIAAWLAQDDPTILDEISWATALAEMKPGPDGVPTMEITTRGTWEEYEGNMYSNLHWMNSWSYTTGTFDYEAWNTWYSKAKAGEFKSSEPYSDSELTTLDRYLQRIQRDEVPIYSLRTEADMSLSWDDYVNKYGAPQPAVVPQKQISETSSDGAKDYSGLSFDEYLEAKYGNEAGFIKDCFAGAHDCDETDEWGNPSSPDRLEVDPDLISEDFETGNNVLARAAACQK
jgi:hypothetical protein